jgi:hypothetical protein
MFMQPKNVLRVKEALLSLLAGDIFGKTPIWRSIYALKVIYYLAALSHPRRSWLAWKKRRFNIQPVEDAEMGSHA